MIVTHKIKMDLSRNRTLRPALNMVQGDSNTRALEISLYDNGQPWEIPDGVTAAVAFSKADGTRGLYDKLPDKSNATTLDGSVVTAILAPEVLTCAGQVRVAIVLYDAEMDTLATFTIMVVVEANPAAGEQVSNNYYYLQNMEQVNAAYADILTRLDELEQNGGGITDTARALLITILRNAVYTSDQSAIITALEQALAENASGGGTGGEEEPDEPVTPEVTLVSISANYTGGDVAVGTAVTALTGITVKATYSDGSTQTVTDYTLSGTIAEGSNTIVVSYGGKTTTFTVTGVAESGGDDSGIDLSDSNIYKSTNADSIQFGANTSPTYAEFMALDVEKLYFYHKPGTQYQKTAQIRAHYTPDWSYTAVACTAEQASSGENGIFTNAWDKYDTDGYLLFEIDVPSLKAQIQAWLDGGTLDVTKGDTVISFRNLDQVVEGSSLYLLYNYNG